MNFGVEDKKTQQKDISNKLMEVAVFWLVAQCRLV
jgi:hypothetical protein